MTMWVRRLEEGLGLGSNIRFIRLYKSCGTHELIYIIGYCARILKELCLFSVFIGHLIWILSWSIVQSSIPKILCFPVQYRIQILLNTLAREMRPIFSFTYDSENLKTLTQQAFLMNHSDEAVLVHFFFLLCGSQGRYLLLPTCTTFVSLPRKDNCKVNVHTAIKKLKSSGSTTQLSWISSLLEARQSGIL